MAASEPPKVKKLAAMMSCLPAWNPKQGSGVREASPNLKFYYNPDKTSSNQKGEVKDYHVTLYFGLTDKDKLLAWQAENNSLVGMELKVKGARIFYNLNNEPENVCALVLELNVPGKFIEVREKLLTDFGLPVNSHNYAGGYVAHMTIGYAFCGETVTAAKEFLEKEYTRTSVTLTGWKDP